MTIRIIRIERIKRNVERGEIYAIDQLSEIARRSGKGEIAPEYQRGHLNPAKRGHYDVAVSLMPLDVTQSANGPRI